MSKQNVPAFPHETAIAYHPGLTKLEYFAAAALPTLVKNTYHAGGICDFEGIAYDAVHIAKALLEELEK